MMQIMDKLTENTRRFTFELSCPVLREVGLEAAIDDFMNSEICEKHGILTEFQHDDEPISIDNDMSIFLYKAARELLINMVKHAEANTVRVSLVKENDNILLTVEDDGIGFNIHEGRVDIDRPGGFGLFSIRERLSCLGGYLKIESKIGHGTKAVIVTPIKPELLSVGDY
jgi:signal transduction histidine kinase